MNAGLSSVVEVLRPVKTQFGSGLTWADLIVLAAQVAIEDASGLQLPFCPGRSDASNGAGSSFLIPPASLNYSATISQINQQLRLSGLNWTDTVALQARLRSPVLMAKTGYFGTFTSNPSVLTNKYFDTLLTGWDAGNWTVVHKQWPFRQSLCRLRCSQVGVSLRRLYQGCQQLRGGSNLCEEEPLLLAMLGCGDHHQELHRLAEWRLRFCEWAVLLQSRSNLQGWPVRASERMPVNTYMPCLLVCQLRKCSFNFVNDNDCQ